MVDRTPLGTSALQPSLPFAFPPMTFEDPTTTRTATLDPPKMPGELRHWMRWISFPRLVWWEYGVPICSKEAVPAEFDAARSWVKRHERVKGLKSYLERVRQEGLISGDIADLALRAWNHLTAVTSSGLLVPDACPGPNGDLLYVWDRAHFHLELEFVPGTVPSFFYANRQTGEAWAVDYDLRSLPDGVWRAFRLFSRTSYLSRAA